MPKITIDLSGQKGLAPRYFGDKFSTSASPQLRTFANPGMYAGGVVNPLARIGYLSPASDTYMSGSTINAECGATIVDTLNGKGYFAERGTTLYNIANLRATTLNTNHTIAGATLTDLEFYTVNGVRKLFYAYQKAGGANIGTFDLSSTYNDTMFSGAIGGFNFGNTNELRMIISDNGFMYILDGSSLHKFNGTTSGGATGTATANVLLFPPFFQLIDGLDLRGKMWIVLMRTPVQIIGVNSSVTPITSMYNEFGGVYIWDRQSTTANMTDFLVVDGIKEIRCIFAFRGLPHLFTVSCDGITQLRAYNGSQFKIIQEMDSGAYPRYHDSVSVNGDMIVWQGANGIQYAYGKNHYLQEADGLYKIGDLNNSAYTHARYAGALMLADGSGGGTTQESYYLSVKDNNSATGQVFKWYPHATTIPETGVTVNPHPGNFFSNVIALPKLTEIESVTVYFPAISASAGTTYMTLSIYQNQSTSALLTQAITGTDLTRGYATFPLGKKNFNYIQFGWTYATGNGIANNVTPSHAELLTKETTKKK